MPMPLPQPIVPDYQEVINNALAQKQRDLFSNAGDLYASGDRTGAINALLRGGEFRQANNLTNMNVADQNRALAKSAGGLAASGNLAGARNAYFAGGDLDSARTMQNFMNSASDRDLAAANRSHAVTANLALAADSPEKWDTTLGTADAMGLNTQKYRQIGQQYGWEAARNAALADHEQMGTLLQNAQTQRDQSNKVVGQAAIQADEDSWPQTLAALKANGYNTQGLDGEAGRQLAIARAGLGQTVFNADAKAEAATNKQTAGTALAKNASFIKTQFESDPNNAGVALSPAVLQKVASNPRGWEIQTQTDPATGQKQAIAVQVSNPKQGAYGLTAELQAQNEKWNADHADEIKSGTLEPKETDLGKLYEYYSGLNTKQKNAATRAQQVNPQSVENVAEARARGAYFGKSEAQQAERIAPLSQINEHIEQAIADADNAESNSLFGRLALSPTARSVKETLNPSEFKDALGRRNIISDVENLREEVQRFYRVAGSGALTDKDKERVDNLLVDLERSPNAAVFKGQMQHLQGTLNAIARGATAKDVYQNPNLAAARSESAARLGETVTKGKAKSPSEMSDDELKKALGLQ